MGSDDNTVDELTSTRTGMQDVVEELEETGVPTRGAGETTTGNMSVEGIPEQFQTQTTQEPSQPNPNPQNLEQVVTEYADTLNYFGDEHGEEKIKLFEVYGEEGTGYNTAFTEIAEDNTLNATVEDVYEWTGDMEQSLDLLEQTGEAFEYTEKAEKVEQILDIVYEH